MSKAKSGHDDEHFAIELERELNALSGNTSTPPDEGRGSLDDQRLANESLAQRIEKSKPALNLLLEFRDKPELLLQPSKHETHPVGRDNTGPERQQGVIPNLQQLGRFTIKREIGRGGNGIVVLADDAELNRKVAIKIPRLESALSGETKSRFMREAKAVAALSHPQIVAIYEVGHDQGVDFIVSPFVEGNSLADWLQRNRVSPRQSAVAVSSLAGAIEHAHQRGVLHRDLKPSNIIVEESTTNGDIAPNCRIVDFGLATIQMEKPGDLTRSGVMLGTPAFMSPEQTGQANATVGPQTDVYGLGVILYQLLTNQPPFDGDDLLRIVEKVRLQSPIAPRKINSDVSHDLNAIVLKCLEKDPGDRYPTAAELQLDLERFLNHDPVQARPASAVHRLKKWVQRNPLATSLLIVLTLGILGTSYGLFQAHAAQNKAELAQEEAQTEATISTEVSDFLEEMFKIPAQLGRGQGQLAGRNVTAEQILIHGAEKIRGELDAQPRVKSELMTVIGSSLAEIQLFEEGETLIRDGLNLRLKHLPPDHPDIANSYRQLGRLLRKMESSDEALRSLRKAIAIYEMNQEKHFQELAKTYNDLGIALRPADALAARAAYCRARDLMQEFRPDDPSIWQLSTNIAVQDYLAGRYELARDAFENALESARKTLGEKHSNVAIVMGNLSRVYLKLGDAPKARRYRSQGVEILEEIHGSDNERVATALLGLIRIDQRIGDLTTAFENGQRALDILTGKFPADHSFVMKARNNHAVTLIRMGAFEDAIRVAQQIDEAYVPRNDKASNLLRLRNQIMRFQIERFSGEYVTAKKRIEDVLSNELLDTDLATGMDARFAQALLLAEMGDPLAVDRLESSLEFAATVPALQPQDLAYFEAQFWALAGEQAKALAKLNEALDAGYNDARIFTDRDLSSLAGLEEFDRCVARVKRALNL